MKPYWQDTLGTSEIPQAKLEKRDGVVSDLVNPEGWLFQALLGRVASSTGIVVTPLRMMGIATVFACIRVMSKTMASLPLILYKGDGHGGRKPAIDDPLYSLLHDAPNVEMSSFGFMAVMEAHLALRQNAFAEIMRDGDGDVVGLYPIDPTDINIYRKSTDNKLYYQFMRGSAEFKAADMLHLRGYSRSGLVGIDLTTNLQEVFALAIALQDNAAKFFGNGSLPGIILSHPGNLSAEAQGRIKEQFEQKSGGVNKYRVSILEEAMTAAVVRSENKDSQFDESRMTQDLQICRVFGVPPHKVGITNSMPRANIEEENIGFVTDVIRAECVCWEKQINCSVLTDEQRGQGYTVEFNLDALMRGNTQERYTAYSLGRNGGWLNANEIRRKEGMNPIGPIGDIFLQPVNYVPLGTLPAPPPQPGDPGGDPNADEQEQTPAKGKPAKKAPATPAPAPAPVVPTADIAPVDDPATQVHPPLLGKPRKISLASDATTLTV